MAEPKKKEPKVYGMIKALEDEIKALKEKLDSQDDTTKFKLLEQQIADLKTEKDKLSAELEEVRKKEPPKTEENFGDKVRKFLFDW